MALRPAPLLLIGTVRPPTINPRDISRRLGPQNWLHARAATFILDHLVRPGALVAFILAVIAVAGGR